MNKYKILITLVVILIMAGAVYATGSLTPPAGTPVPTSYTMSDVYNKLVNGTVAGSHTLTTTGAVAPTFRTLSEIYNAIPNALSISPSSTAVPVGINRTATALNNIDTDLIADNIRSGVNIFGIAGTYTGSGGTSLTWSARAPVLLCYNSATTCLPSAGYSGHINGLGAFEYCKYLMNDGVTLATVAQNIWRLPTRLDFQSITDPTRRSPASSHPVMQFVPQSYYFWTSDINTAATLPSNFVWDWIGGILSSFRSYTNVINTICVK